MKKNPTYKIQGKTLTQSELTLRQDIQLIKLFGELEIPETADIGSMITKLVESDSIDKLFGIILGGDVDDIEIQDLTNSEVEEVWSDFLELNDGLIHKLSHYLSEIPSLTKKKEVA